MKNKVSKVIIFFMRLIFSLAILLTVFAKNMMAYLDTGEIGDIIKLLEKYKGIFSLEHMNEQDLFLYKMIYILNEYYLSFVLIIFITWITIEIIIRTTQKNGRNI